MQQSLDQAQGRRELAGVAEHPESACIPPNFCPSHSQSLLLISHLPGAVSPTSEGYPATGLSCLSCFGLETTCCPCANGQAVAHQLVQGNVVLRGALAPTLAHFVSMQVVSNKLLPQQRNVMQSKKIGVDNFGK